MDAIDRRVRAESNGDPTAKTPTSEALKAARTTAFVSLVWSDNLRSYACRSFYNPVWVDLCTNPMMQKAIFLAQIGLYCALFIPVFSDTIMELEGRSMHWEGWVAAALGAIYTLIGCEIYKCLSQSQIRAWQQRMADELEKKETEREQLAQERRKQFASKKEDPEVAAIKAD